jgi:3-hydroxyacyl-[acyl-carrier-protein] dehydratase
MNHIQNILDRLPYSKPYRFVDEITLVSEKKIEGNYTFCKDEFFYKGHFTGNPVTPGLILVECMGQIGLVSLAIYLFPDIKFSPLLLHVEAEFLLPVYPEEKVFVESEVVFCRNGFLKCKIKMLNKNKIEVAHTIAILKLKENE